MPQGTPLLTRRAKNLLIAGIILIAANLRAPLTSVGPLLDAISQQLMLSSTAVGLLSALPLLLFALLSPISPKIAAKLGTERALWLATLLLVIGIITRSLPYHVLLWLGNAQIGAAIAFANVVLPTLVKKYFPQRSSAVISAYVSVMSIAAASASGLAIPLAQWHNSGWQISLLYWALPAFVALIIWTPQLKISPQVPNPAQIKEATQKSYSPWQNLLSWYIALFMGIQSLIFYTIISWFSIFAIDNAISEHKISLALFIYQIVSIFATFIMAFVLPRAKDQKIVALFSSLLITSGIAGLILSPYYSIIWLAMAGLGAGCCLVLALSFFNLRSQNHQHATALSGMAQSVGYLLAACGPIMFGMLHDMSQNWQIPLLTLLFLSLLQALFGTLAGRNHTIT